MSLSPAIVKHLARLRAVLLTTPGRDAVTTLVWDVIWPDSIFTGSIRQVREYLTSQGAIGVQNWSDDKLGEELPIICGLRFLPLNCRGKFWEGWEASFPSVDPAMLFPLAVDDHYFYFIATNNADISDPLVYTLDHEETDVEPFNGRFGVVSHLLAILEAEKSNTRGEML
jgi:hypothetical protein